MRPYKAGFMQRNPHLRAKFTIRNSTFILLLALLTAQLVVQARPAPTPAPPEPAPNLAAIQPINPKIGVHTRLTDEPDPKKIDQTLRMVHDMGASWVVEYFPWSYIQPTDANHYDWQHADEVVNAASAYSLTLIARIDGVPTWARPDHPDPAMWRYLDAAHYGQFASFVAAFVRRYHDRVHYFIIWNEQNTAAEWGERPPDPAAFADLMRTVYPAAKAADPRAILMPGGLAPNLEPATSQVAISDLAYLAAYYKAGGGAYFDALAAHVYPLSVPPPPPTDPSSPDKLNFNRVEELRKIMVANGDSAKQIYITEGGWNDNPRFSFAVRPAQRIEYTIGAYQEALNWPWCSAVNIWAFSLPKPTYTYMDNYTFVAPDLVPKPIYLEVQKYALGNLSNDG